MNYDKILQIQEKLIRQKIKQIKRQNIIIFEMFKLATNLKDEQVNYLKKCDEENFERLQQFLLEIFGTKKEKETIKFKNIEKLNEMQELFEKLIYTEPHYIERRK